MDVPSDLMEVVPILLKLRDLAELGDVALLDLARDARIETLRPGDAVAADRQPDRHVYLLDGEVELVSGGRVMQTVSAGTERALTPLFRIPHSRTHCTLCASRAPVIARPGDYSAALKPPHAFGITLEEGPASDDPTGLVDEQWGLEADLVTVAREAKDWQRDVQTADYCDLVQVAQLHCALTGGHRISAPDIRDLPAFERLRLHDIDPDRVIEDARREIDAMISLLSG